ncbi:hypothetical protein MTO96_036896, partial [Rhipicephalus appendiculatus]
CPAEKVPKEAQPPSPQPPRARRPSQPRSRTSSSTYPTLRQTSTQRKGSNWRRPLSSRRHRQCSTSRGDDDKYLRKQKSALKWDRKRKRFVREDSDPKNKKIRTESGAWIPASYKSDVYKQWRKKAQMDARDEGSGDDEEGEAGSGLGKQKASACDRLGKRHSGPARQKGPKKHFRRELKTKEEILKTRKRKARLNYHVKKKHMERAAKKRRK